jgi:hypothetical protein
MVRLGSHVDSKSTVTLVKRFLTEDAPVVRQSFLDALSSELVDFAPMMGQAFDLCERFREFSEGNDSREMVYWLLFNAVQGHLTSMRIFVDGFLVPSCSLQRQVLESIAMALLVSKPELGFAERFSNEKYSSSKAIQDVIRRADTLSIDRAGMETIKSMARFYDQFSHPTLMTIALYNSFDEPEKRCIGGNFDQAKIEQYKIEGASRVKLAELLCNAISGIGGGMESRQQS